MAEAQGSHPPPDEDDVYISEEDEDFDPTAAAPDENVSSSSEPESRAPVPDKRRAPKGGRRKSRKPREEEAEDAGFENSGDEGIISKGRKRKRKGSVQGESGGEGGFVKTRSMRAVAEKEKAKQPLSAVDGNITIDVDALWNSMKAASIVPQSGGSQPSQAPDSENAPALLGDADQQDSEMMTITETYTYAGELHTRTSTVPRNSAQAKLFLSQNKAPGSTAVPPTQKKGPDGQLLYRPFRRVSPWDPNPDGIVPNMPTRRDGANPVDAAGKPKKGLRVVDKSKLGWHGGATSAEAAVVAAAKASAKAAPKLNVVDKSKRDWAEHVDRAGDRDELERAAKSKGDYLERRRFLDRVEGKQDEQFAQARRKQ